MAIGAEPLVVWINGAFGVGKTAVAYEAVHIRARVADRRPGASA